MALPAVYKYLGVQGAKLTLGNRTFKHAKPSDFNDVEDLTIQSIFPEETEGTLRKLSNGFADIVLQHLNDMPTCGSPMKEQLQLIQCIYRNNPDAAGVVKAEITKEELVFNIGHMRSLADAFVAEMNEFLQGYRVLCVTTHKDSEAMWSEYAENHKGIALRIEPNVNKDSKFQLFHQVVYREKRPPLYEDTLEFIAGSLFGDQEMRRGAILEKIVYTKTLKWAHENEYRLAIPMRENEASWHTLTYHPEEVTELYLGLAMENADRKKIVGLALATNPNIMIFKSRRDADGSLKFDRA